MEDMEKKLKMKLLEQLMMEMDDASASKLKKDEPMVEVVETEAEVVPASEAEDMIEEKMSDAMKMDESYEEDYDEEMDYEDDEYEDEYNGSSLMAKLKEMRKKKKEDME